MIDGELGAFLRSRREALAPGDVGLPAGGRRRTSGLRRAEVAVLAGISVEYLTRLEQGRDRHPSTQVLGALATALRLDAGDRAHLQELSTVSRGTELMCSGPPAPARTVRPTVRRVLEMLHPAPAHVVNRLGDVLAWNTAFDVFARPLGLLRDSPPNVIRFVFGDDARDAIADWGAMADRTVAALHASQRGDLLVEELVAELTAAVGVEFVDRWERRLLAVAVLPTVRWIHPDVGPVDLDTEILELGDVDGQQLIVYLAANDATSAALDRLAGRRPGGLRSVDAG